MQEFLENATGLVWAAQDTGWGGFGYMATIMEYQLLATDDDCDLPREGGPLLIGVYGVHEDALGEEAYAYFEGPDAVRRLMAFLFPE